MTASLIADFPTVSVGDRVLCRNLHLSLEPGKILGLTGPNGCGKTITLDYICGLRKSHGSSVTVGQVSIDGLGMFERWQMGIRRMFQQPSLPGNVDVKETLRHYANGSILNVYGMDLLAKAGIRTSRSVQNLSYGQRRIVEIAALANSGSIFLLDEPFAGLADSIHQVITHVVRYLSSIGAVLIIDHSIERLKTIAHQVITWPSHDGSRTDDVQWEPLIKLVTESPKWSMGARPAKWSIQKITAGQRVLAEKLVINTRPGELLNVLGPNGSGKSTLLRALADLPQPEGISCIGVQCEVPSSEIHLSPQPPKLIPSISVRDNLALMHNRDPAKDRRNPLVQNLLERAGMEQGILASPSSRLSGGEAALLSLIGAAMAGRPFLLLDEPFEGLSPTGLRFAADLLSALLLRGTTAIVITHSMLLEGFENQKLTLPYSCAGSNHDIE